MQIKYSYAQDKDGHILHISEATRGECYTCLGCKEPIRPRLGKIQRQHFYHPKAVCSPESYLYNLSQDAHLRLVQSKFYSIARSAYQ